MNHFYQEGNRCVDALARLGTSQASDFVVYHTPMELQSVFNFDVQELYSNKLSPETFSSHWFNKFPFLPKKIKNKK